MDVSESQTKEEEASSQTKEEEVTNDEKTSQDMTDIDTQKEEPVNDALSSEDASKDVEKTLTEDKATTSEEPPKDVSTSDKTMEEGPKEAEAGDAQETQTKTLSLDGADKTSGTFEGLEAGLEYTIQIFTVCGDRESEAVELTASTSKRIVSIRD